MPKRILLVDDDPSISGLLRIYFEAEGFVIVVTDNGASALKLAEDSHFDLIVTDLFMPEKDGLEFLQALRRKSTNTKIIAVSGGGAGMSPEVFLKIARHQGAARTFEKPFDGKELVKAAKELLD